MQDLLLSNEFRRYRKAQINEIVKFIKPMIISFDNAAEIKGALDMARKLMKLPETFPLSGDIKERIRNEMHEDMKEFEVKYIRGHLIDDSR